MVLPVANTFRELEEFQLKRRPETGETWLAFFCLHPHRKSKAWTRTGGLPVIQRLLAKLGFTGVWLDLQQWDELSPEEKCSHVRDVVASHGAKF